MYLQNIDQNGKYFCVHNSKSRNNNCAKVKQKFAFKSIQY